MMSATRYVQMVSCVQWMVGVSFLRMAARCRWVVLITGHLASSATAAPATAPPTSGPASRPAPGLGERASLMHRGYTLFSGTSSVDLEALGQERLSPIFLRPARLT